VLFFLLIVNQTFGNSFDTTTAIVIAKLNAPIQFDGIPNEEAWNEIDPFPMIVHSPVFGKEPSERSDIRLAFDDHYVYLGASMYDSDPSKIQMTTKKRDDVSGGSDWLGLILDTYNDNENAVCFLTTPEGLRTDMTVDNDANGEMPLSQNWNTFWDVKTAVTDEGWFAEIRIPVSSLRFQEINGQVTMGMIVWRWIPHLNEQYIYPSISQEYGEFSPWKPSLAQKIIFHGLKSKKPLYIAPYLLAGMTSQNQLNDAETEYDFRRDEVLDVGLDVKFGLTSNLTMDVTLNTDFAQVEADDEMVNLTRFSLFYPEKRQFFLERSSVFEFNTGGPGSLFYSRRIGLDEDYNPVPIIGGVRLIGRQGPWDIAFLNMQTVKSDNLPSENFGVFRTKKRIINDYSYVGGILTSRLGTDGSFNEVYGLDLLIRMFGDEYLKLFWAQSFDDEEDNDPFTLDISRYMINWERKRSVGFNYDLFLTGSGKNFEPELGFEYRDDYHAYGAFLDYIWLMPEESKLINHGIYLELFNHISQSRGIHESISINPSYGFISKTYWQGRFGIEYSYENVFEAFELSDDAEILAGEYSFAQLEGRFYTPMSKPYWAMLRLQAGDYYDGKGITASVTPTWNMSSSFEISGTYLYNWVDFPVRDQYFVAHIGRLKAIYMFSTKLSLSAFVQYNSAEDVIISNFRFRYNPREGNDLYIVYNEGTNTSLDDTDIIKVPRMSDRTIVLKYTYTFAF